MEYLKSIFPFRRGSRVPTQIESQTKSLGDLLAEKNQPFPYGLLSQEERVAVDKQIRGTASVTAGGVILSPWHCLEDSRVKELADQAKGIGRTSSGLSDLDPQVWRP